MTDIFLITIIIGVLFNATLIIVTSYLLRKEEKKSTAFLNEKMMVIKQESDREFKRSLEAGHRRLEEFQRLIGVRMAQVVERLNLPEEPGPPEKPEN